MSLLSFIEFKKLSSRGNRIILKQTLPADLETPVSAFLKVERDAPHAFLLESAEQQEKIGRFSFIGINPSQILTSRAGVLSISQPGTKPILCNSPVLDFLQEKSRVFKLANPSELPAFCGGYVGFLGYENVTFFEDVRLSAKKSLSIPESIFFLSDQLIVFDHFQKTLSIAVIADTASRSAVSAYRTAMRDISVIERKLKQPLSIRNSKPNGLRPLSVKALMSKADFVSKVKRIRSYIKAGDCIQVVLSQRFELPKISDDFQVYRALRSVNPSPYMFYFRSGPFRLIGASPEMLVKKEGRSAEVRPIAGTRPRGISESEDLHFELQLKKSVKEMAEHLMLVDLGRNDLGRVCKFDTIKVGHFARIERYSHVMHLVSDVQGTLKSGRTSFDLLKATFPAGTVSGAPKIRAMQIVNELEEHARGPYAGCLGYFSFNQDMDMCITIRTLFTDGHRMYLQSGAGIVKDSNPEKEYEETVNKAKALLKAVERRGEF